MDFIKKKEKIVFLGNLLVLYFCGEMVFGSILIGRERVVFIVKGRVSIGGGYRRGGIVG